MKIKLAIVDSFPEKSEPLPFKYYYEGNHIENWQYSPEKASKIILMIVSLIIFAKN